MAAVERPGAGPGPEPGSGSGTRARTGSGSVSGSGSGAGSGPGSGSTPPARVYFQAGGDGDVEPLPRRQGKVTVKYDRRELRRRLNLEEWIIEQLTQLYGCEEESIPELEIDVDELLDLPSNEERASRVKDLLIACYKPTDEFVKELLSRIQGMQKFSTPQKYSPQPPK